MKGPSLAAPGEGNDYQAAFVARVAASFARVTGNSLVAGPVGAMLGRHVYYADFALLCHRGGEDAVLNYGNALALRLWESDWGSFVSTPSSVTAPREDSAERTTMMERVARDNFVTGYCGRRISRTGRLFMIKNVTVWRLLDETGNAFGVGATFQDYEYL